MEYLIVTAGVFTALVLKDVIEGVTFGIIRRRAAEKRLALVKKYQSEIEAKLAAAEVVET